MDQVEDLFEENKIGCAELQKYDVSEEASMWASLRSPCPLLPGRYIRLMINNKLYMSDTLMEQNTNKEFIDNARGDVMIGGLGIGLVIWNLLYKINDGTITSLTVYEKYRDVIDLVWPTVKRWLPDDFRARCLEADLLEYIPQHDDKYDTIYFDIWPDICSDNYEDILMLHKRWKRKKRPGGWMDSWVRKTVRKMWNREQSEEEYF